jgi:NitT/TauT family transport system substrate-binding protein
MIAVGRGRPPKRGRWFVAICVTLGVLGIAGCGGDDGDASSATTAAPSGSAATNTTVSTKRESLKLGSSTTAVVFTPFYVAKNAGFFEEENLDLSVEQLGGNVGNAVISERVDLAMIGPGAALIPVKDGKDTKIIYNHVGNGLLILAATKGITKATDCKRVATLNPGSSMYGWAVAFKGGFSASYDIVPFGDVPSVAAAVTSGNTDCATMTISQFDKAEKDGLVTGLADPRRPDTMPAGNEVPKDLHEGAFWGLTDNLKKKEEAVIRFTRAIDKAVKFIEDNDDLTVAKILRKEKDIALLGDDAAVAADVAANRYAFAPHGGYIDQTDWDNCLKFLKASGLDFIDPSDPKWQREARVDMTYLERGRARS